MARRDSTSDNQFSHTQPPADAAGQIPHADPITRPYKPAPKPTATAPKPHDTWKAELMAGMGLPAQQQRRAFFQGKHLPNTPRLTSQPLKNL